MIGATSIAACNRLCHSNCKIVRDHLRRDDVARVLLRRLIGPLEAWNPAAPSAEWSTWEASLPPALLEGLAATQVGTSPRGIFKWDAFKSGAFKTEARRVGGPLRRAP